MPTKIDDALARRQAEWEERLASHPTSHPHKLSLVLDYNVIPHVECPGEEHCALVYAMPPSGPGSYKCGLQLEAEELGHEFFDLMVGPSRFVPASNSFPIAFTSTWGGNDEEPPTIEWWPLPNPLAPVQAQE
jgi:hypothetical protein